MGNRLRIFFFFFFFNPQVWKRAKKKIGCFILQGLFSFFFFLFLFSGFRFSLQAIVFFSRYKSFLTWSSVPNFFFFLVTRTCCKRGPKKKPRPQYRDIRDGVFLSDRSFFDVLSQSPPPKYNGMKKSLVFKKLHTFIFTFYNCFFFLGGGGSPCTVCYILVATSAKQTIKRKPVEACTE